MSILWVHRGNGKPLVDILYKSTFQHCIGRFDVADLSQPELLHKSVLEHPMSTLYPSLSLGTVGCDNLNTQLLGHHLFLGS